MGLLHNKDESEEGVGVDQFYFFIFFNVFYVFPLIPIIHSVSVLLGLGQEDLELDC